MAALQQSAKVEMAWGNGESKSNMEHHLRKDRREELMTYLGYATLFGESTGDVDIWQLGVPNGWWESTCSLDRLGVTVPYWSFGDTIPVSTVARVHFLSPKLWYNTTNFGCHAFLLANFWYLHTTIFEDNFSPHPKVRQQTSSMTRVWGEVWPCQVPPHMIKIQV